MRSSWICRPCVNTVNTWATASGWRSTFHPVSDVQAHLFVRDEAIDGKITLEQNDIQLKPQLAEKYAKYVTPDSLNACGSKVPLNSLSQLPEPPSTPYR